MYCEYFRKDKEVCSIVNKRLDMVIGGLPVSCKKCAHLPFKDLLDGNKSSQN